MAVAIAATSAASAQQLPSGGTVTSGSAEISQSGSNLLVTQTSRNAILSWQSFSIGGAASAHFENGTGATLNRVTGNLPSSIDGSLTATGSLYLINPAGVVVGTGGMVRTGGSFIASTHDAADADFLDGGGLTLRGDSKAGVVNRGTIVSRSGDVVLTARRVENAGDIEAPNGSVGLLGGYEVELRDTSLADGKFAVKIGGSDAEVVNSGSIRAAEVELRANGGNVQALAGNTRKIIKATGVKKVGGRIFLTAGDGGSVTVTQRIVARRAVQPAQKAAVAALPDFGPLPAARPDFSGGEVHIEGGTVSLGGDIDAAGSGGEGGTITATAAGKLSLASTAALDASGNNGGLILLGGDYQGGSNPAIRYLDAALARTASTTVEAGATIAANGTVGDGGNVVIWSDEKTDFAGTISATGGSQGGNAEVSGKAVLAYTGFADLSAANGAFGMLLLDPYDVTISSGADTLGSGPGFTAGANNSVINVATLQTALAGANVTVSTGAGGGQAGDITVAAPITWSSGSTLTLDAYHSIAINAPVTVAGAGGLSLVTNHGGSGGTLSFSGGVQYTGTPNSGQSLSINGQAYTLLYSMSDLQGINNGLNGRYALARSLDATGVTGWVPLGTDGAGTILNSNNGFAGTFDGLGNTISNLNVDIGNSNYAGLFGYSSGTISDIGLLGGSVKGRNNIGGLVGASGLGRITRAYTTGAVTGADWVGGLVGSQWGSRIMQACATGQVTGRYEVGGLVGESSASGIEQAYATGTVIGTSHVGGLVGFLGGNITQAYATGQVTGDSYVGGLVGDIAGFGSIASSYFDTYSTGQDASKGVGNAAAAAAGLASGITAVTSDPTQVGAANYAYKQSAYSGLSFTTTPGGSGWYMIDGQTRPFSAWEYSTTIVNGHQLQLVNMDLNASYRLARSIDLGPDLASATVNGNITYPGMWRLGSFVPLGTDGANSVLNNSNGFAGTFDGLGNILSNLNVDIGGYSFAGLFGWSVGAIRDVGLIGGSVKGFNFSGGLVGYQSGGGIARAYAITQVAGTSTVGGLVGYLSDGLVIQAYAAGQVTGGDYVGGLVGMQSGGGIVTQAYATGQVTGDNRVGGLVGNQSGGSITQAYATGEVTGDGGVGGLVGFQSGGSITQAYAIGQVTGGQSVGGLVGQQVDGSITQAYATGQVTGDSYTGGLVGFRYDGSITQAYATGQVTGGSYTGGLVGYQSGGLVISSYFDTDTTGQTFGVGAGSQAGATALSSVSGSAFVKASYAGFDWTVWAPASAAAGSSPAYYPELYGVSGVVGVDYGSATITYGNAAPVFGAPSAIYGIGYFNQWTTAPGAGTVASTNAGTYAVSSSGASATFTPGGQSRIVNLGTLTITPATLTVAANAASKIYGNLDPTLAYTASGFKFSDNDTLLSGMLSRAAGENVGSYAIGMGSLSAGGNYTIAYTSANLAITPATLTVASNAASKIYGNLDPTLGYTASGFKFSDDDTLLSGALSRAAGENVGDYAIGKGSLSAGGNYTIAYTGANLAITPRAITVTANDRSRSQGQPDPALTWAVTGGSLASFDSNANVFSGSLARDPGEAAGTYAIDKGSLDANLNYALTFVAGTFTIEPAQTAAQHTNAQALERQGDQGAGLFLSPVLLSSLLLSEAVDAGETGTCSEGVLGPECVALVHPANRDVGPYMRVTE